MINKILSFFALIFLTSCATKSNDHLILPTVSPQKVTYFDTTRNREIPLAIYAAKNSEIKKLPVVIFSHGYGRNTPDSYLGYQYLLENLAQKGYFVVSIQHELATDDFLPLEGNPQILRRTNWERGSQNILFVLQQLRSNYPNLDYRKVSIAGHSNGGDMSVLFTEQYPDLVWKLITLDQRRYTFPRTSKPKTYSLRSSDQPADEGVLPTLKEQETFDMTIIKLPNTIHNDMDDSGTLPQKKEIANYFLQFLED